MKVLHVIPAFHPARVYGGPIESVFQLCRQLVANHCEVRVLTTDANGLQQVLRVDTATEQKLGRNICVRYCPRLICTSVSPQLIRLLPVYIRWADVVHLTGVYSFPTIPTLLACSLLGKPVVWSPRGSFGRWSGTRKVCVKATWNWLCRRVAPGRLVLHATSEEEGHDTLKLFPDRKTVIVPNGVTVPRDMHKPDHEGPLRLLYLGRLDPKKGIENLLSACKLLAQKRCLSWSLTIAGTGTPHYTEGIRSSVHELQLAKHVRMPGEVQGFSKRRLLEDSDVVVVPSYIENFGMVVAEALAHGVPVIASTGTPWRHVEKCGCGLFVENDPESLALAIVKISRMPLRQMGKLGRDWMATDFSWDRSAGKMMDTYRELAASRHAN